MDIYNPFCGGGVFLKVFYTPSLLLESFKPFVGVFLEKFRNFSHLMILDGFNLPIIYIRKTNAQTLYFP